MSGRRRSRLIRIVTFATPLASLIQTPEPIPAPTFYELKAHGARRGLIYVTGGLGIGMLTVAMGTVYGKPSGPEAAPHPGHVAGRSASLSGTGHTCLHPGQWNRIVVYMGTLHSDDIQRVQPKTA